MYVSISVFDGEVTKYIYANSIFPVEFTQDIVHTNLGVVYKNIPLRQIYNGYPGFRMPSIND
jgi:hypothetical protein